jgi:hypothetical protein
MSTKTALKTKFENGDRPNQTDFADLIDSNLNLESTNVLSRNVGFTLVSTNITTTTLTQDLSLGNVFYFDITAGSGNFTFDYSNAVVGTYYFIFRRAATLAIRNITWASGKYASAFGALPMLTSPTVSVDGLDLVMGIFVNNRMILVQQASILNN